MSDHRSVFQPAAASSLPQPSNASAQAFHQANNGGSPNGVATSGTDEADALSVCDSEDALDSALAQVEANASTGSSTGSWASVTTGDVLAQTVSSSAIQASLDTAPPAPQPQQELKLAKAVRCTGTKVGGGRCASKTTNLSKKCHTHNE